MVKRILFLLVVTLLASCNATKPVVRTTKPAVKKTNTVVKKPAVTAKTGNASTSEKKSSTTTSQEKNKTEVLEATSNIKVTTEIVLKYISDFKEIAKNNMINHGVPASITLAQGILESGSGLGVLSQKANNHFGIKCHKEWTGESVRHDDDSEQECFRKYEHPSESYRDHSLFLTSRSRYASLFALDKDDYKSWAKGLKAAGYATDPKYPDKLISLIDRYQLNQYDAEVLETNNFKKTTPSSYAVSEKEYTVTQGDTLYSLSKKFNISVDDLKKKNNIKDNAISIGQVLKVK
jgi:flagellum-specific peptidoglycan hydrolase FlgJ